MDPFLIIGTIGMVMILVAFLLIQNHKLSVDGLAYDLLNCIGCGLLVISAWPARLWPFIILNGIFALYSLRDIIWSDLKTVKVVRKA